MALGKVEIIYKIYNTCPKLLKQLTAQILVSKQPYYGTLFNSVF